MARRVLLMFVVAASIAPSAARADRATPLELGPTAGRGTVVLVHGGGWAGTDPEHQQDILTRLGPTAAAAGYRVVSLDYEKGVAGLPDVERQLREELAARPTHGPVCLYGESSGAQLALLAARDLGRVDCVVAAGTPVNFETWPAEAEAQGLALSLRVFLRTVVPTFGEPGPGNLIWQPAAEARRIRADVLLVRQADDLVVPARQAADYRAQDPTAREWVAEPAPAGTPPILWMHGTLSPRARDALPQVLLAAVRSAGRERAQVRAAGLPACRAATRSVLEMSTAAVETAVSCLVGRRGPARARLHLQGHPTPARIAAALLRARSGRPARQRRRYAVRIHLGATTTVVVRERALH